MLIPNESKNIGRDEWVTDEREKPSLIITWLEGRGISCYETGIWFISRKMLNITCIIYTILLHRMPTSFPCWRRVSYRICWAVAGQKERGSTSKSPVFQNPRPPEHYPNRRSKEKAAEVREIDKSNLQTHSHMNILLLESGVRIFRSLGSCNWCYRCLLTTTGIRITLRLIHHRMMLLPHLPYWITWTDVAAAAKTSYVWSLTASFRYSVTIGKAACFHDPHNNSNRSSRHSPEFLITLCKEIKKYVCIVCITSGACVVCR